MSFFFDGFDEYILKNRKTVDDGYGGAVTTWEDGATVKASFDLGSAAEIRQAEAQALRTVYTASFPIDTPVRYNDYLEDVKTGAIYRVTADPRENTTPETATYQACFASAVRTELPR